MKTGIISVNKNTRELNYASVLQPYVLQQFLDEKGIDNVIIDYQPADCRKTDGKHPLFSCIDYPAADKEVQQQRLKQWKQLFCEREERYNKFEQFVNRNYHKSDIRYTEAATRDTDPFCDCYICYSDIIRIAADGKLDGGMLLATEMLDKKRKIAYAVSSSWSDLPDSQLKEFVQAIKSFDDVSVQREDLQMHLKNDAGVTAPRVADPLFLKDKEFYSKLAEVPDRDKPFVLIYMERNRAEELISRALDYAREHNLEVIEIAEAVDGEDIRAITSHEVIYTAGIEEWLGYIMAAACVFTNSYHTCCLSVIFEKRFQTGEDQQGSLKCLTESLGSEYIDKEITENDYPVIRPRVQQVAEESSRYLLDQLNHIEKKRKSFMARAYRYMNRKLGREKTGNALAKEKFITENPGTVIMKKNDHIYWSPEFSKKTKTGNMLDMGESVPVLDIVYSDKGVPRLKVRGGYITANLKYIKPGE